MKLATPATACTPVVPPNVAPPGPPATASVTVPANAVATFPPASRATSSTSKGTSTGTAGGGGVANASCVAAPADTSNGLLCTEATPAAEASSWYPVAAIPIAKSSNTATPFTAATFSVPPSGFCPVGSTPRVIVITRDEVSTRNPLASSTCTSTAGSAVSAVPLTGCTANDNCVGAPAAAAALNSTKKSGTSAMKARTVCGPGSAPTVSTVATSPFASELAAAMLSVPLPAVTANTTSTPSTPRPSAAMTRATSGAASAVATVADCASPETTAMPLATGCTVIACVAPRSAGVKARTTTGPRTSPTTSRPARASVTRARSVSAESASARPIGVPAIGFC